MAGRGATLVAGSALLLAALTGCGASTAMFTADPRHYLLTLDELSSPDFTVSSPAAPLAGGSQATVTFARTVDFATSNGPIEVIDAVARFASNGGAHAAYAHDIASRDAQQGEVAMSAGALGDEAHADSVVMTAPDGLQAVQVTLEWRVANLLITLVLRGRYGGTRLDDALTLAHTQTSSQLTS